jgi:hypothetical protein
MALHLGRRTRVRRAAVVSALAAATLGGSVIASTAARADDTAPPPNPAVLGPLLKMFYYGDQLGVPLGCQAVSAAIGSGAGYYGQAATVYPLISAMNDGCNQIAAAGASMVAQGQTASAPLSAWNPFVNPLLSTAGSTVTTQGGTYGSALNPAGATVAGLGGTIDFFEGS